MVFNVQKNIHIRSNHSFSLGIYEFIDKEGKIIQTEAEREKALALLEK